MSAAGHVFQRVVCGADGSEPSAAAVALAARVVAEEGFLTLVTVDDVSTAVHAGWAMSRVADQLAQEAIAASEHAQAESSPLHEAETRLLEGNPLDVLRAEIDRVDGTLVVVGSRDHSRAVGIALGSVTTHLLHEAPCSVLVARSRRELEQWPRTIIAGVDGSPGSALALAAAHDLARRHGSSVRVVAATREPQLDLDAARALAPELEEHDERVLDLLHTISEEADLVVVGSRGLRGIRALGSVSERVAHEALCPVLVVRGGDD